MPTINQLFIFSTLFLLSGGLTTCGSDSESSTAADGPPSYQAQHRPQLHFSPPAKWMNDPNGMVFFEDEYHLFYQYYPDSTVWGPMHWGHAVSTDLTHWENLDVALKPDDNGYIFSGSCVIDWENTSGFSPDGEPAMVAVFTYHDPVGADAGRDDFQTQGIAYSLDRGRTWTKYAENPVLANPGIRDFRDPKVFWHGDSEQWVMTLAVKDRVQFYGSPNLKDWRYLSEFGTRHGAHDGVWECPDLFPLHIAETGATNWVLLVSLNPGAPNGGSGTQYFVGEFDGERFKLDEIFAAQLRKAPGKAVWLDYGRDNYAGVTWSDIPSDDGRRLFLGWMSNWDYAQVTPTRGWRSAMTLPRELVLENTAKGPRLIQQLPNELQALREEPQEIEIGTTPSQVLNLSPQQLELMLRAAVDERSRTRFGFELTNEAGERYRIGYDAGTQNYFSDRRQAGKTDFSPQFADSLHLAPKQLEGALITMQLVFDRSSVELLADDGLVALTDCYFPNQDFTTITYFVDSTDVSIQRLEAWELEGIW